MFQFYMKYIGKLVSVWTLSVNMVDETKPDHVKFMFDMKID